MTWVAGDGAVADDGQPYYWRSACGQYTVCRAWAMGQWKWDAWRVGAMEKNEAGKQSRGVAQLIAGGLASSKDARAACTAHGCPG